MQIALVYKDHNWTLLASFGELRPDLRPRGWTFWLESSTIWNGCESCLWHVFPISQFKIEIDKCPELMITSHECSVKLVNNIRTIWSHEQLSLHLKQGDMNCPVCETWSVTYSAAASTPSSSVKSSAEANSPGAKFQEMKAASEGRRRRRDKSSFTDVVQSLTCMSPDLPIFPSRKLPNLDFMHILSIAVGFCWKPILMTYHAEWEFLILACMHPFLGMSLAWIRSMIQIVFTQPPRMKIQPGILQSCWGALNWFQP